MSEYIHEIVLQEYIIENISSLNLTKKHSSVPAKEKRLTIRG